MLGGSFIGGSTVYHSESHTLCIMHVAIDLHWIIIKDWTGHADHHGPELVASDHS